MGRGHNGRHIMLTHDAFDRPSATRSIRSRRTVSSSGLLLHETQFADDRQWLAVAHARRQAQAHKCAP